MKYYCKIFMHFRCAKNMHKPSAVFLTVNLSEFLI